MFLDLFQCWCADFGLHQHRPRLLTHLSLHKLVLFHMRKYQRIQHGIDKDTLACHVCLRDSHLAIPTPSTDQHCTLKQTSPPTRVRSTKKPVHRTTTEWSHSSISHRHSDDQARNYYVCDQATWAKDAMKLGEYLRKHLDVFFYSTHILPSAVRWGSVKSDKIEGHLRRGSESYKIGH